MRFDLGAGAWSPLPDEVISRDEATQVQQLVFQRRVLISEIHSLHVEANAKRRQRGRLSKLSAHFRGAQLPPRFLEEVVPQEESLTKEQRAAATKRWHFEVEVSRLALEKAGEALVVWPRARRWPPLPEDRCIRLKRAAVSHRLAQRSAALSGFSSRPHALSQPVLQLLLQAPPEEITQNSVEDAALAAHGDASMAQEGRHRRCEEESSQSADHIDPEAPVQSP